jgi:hypothetical protein
MRACAPWYCPPRSTVAFASSPLLPEPWLHVVRPVSSARECVVPRPGAKVYRRPALHFLVLHRCWIIYTRGDRSFRFGRT